MGEQTSIAGAPSSTAPGAFGMAIDSDAGIPGLDTPSAVAGSRRVEHRLVSRGAIRERSKDGTLTVLGSDGEGRQYREYLQHSSGSQLIRTKSYGEHLIAEKGGTIFSAIEGEEPNLWKRYVLGQLLPIAASVQGLEIFHASAVATARGVVALAGPSGAGKSSVAAAMLSEETEFFVDDVLAVELTTSGVAAYPGPALISLPLGEFEQLGDRVAGPPWFSDDRKAIVPIRGERRSLPILAFIALSVDEGAADLEFAPCPPNRLMGLTFEGLSRTPERLRRLLRVSAMLAADSRALEVRFSTQTSAAMIGAAILERFEMAPALQRR